MTVEPFSDKGGKGMSPVLELPEAVCVRHGPYRGLECPGCSEGEKAEPENR